MLVYTTGLIGTAFPPYNSKTSLQVPIIIALSNWVAISLFIFAAAPASGGHLNPLITLSTFTAGLATLPRTVLYVLAQMIGALIGGFFLKLGLGGKDYYPLVSSKQPLETRPEITAYPITTCSYQAQCSPSFRQVANLALACSLIGICRWLHYRYNVHFIRTSICLRDGRVSRFNISRFWRRS